MVVDSIENALKVCKDDPQPFIIGGGEIYKLGLEYSKRIELTRVHHNFEGDTIFPEIDKEIWKEVKKIKMFDIENHDYNFSFSGLKTAVLYKVNELKKEGELSNQLISNICLEFQNAAIDCLLHKTNKALIDFDLKQVVLSGGVAANKELRRRFSTDLHQGCSAIYPDFSHCTDNGTMIAFTGYEKINLPKEDNKISVNPKWSLEEVDNG